MKFQTKRPLFSKGKRPATEQEPGPDGEASGTAAERTVGKRANRRRVVFFIIMGWVLWVLVGGSG